jgi:multiple sugar transport system ATP-binding protein
VTVEFSEQLGGQTYLYCSGGGLNDLTVHQMGQLDTRQGDTLHLALDRTKMHVFGADGAAIANGL